MVFSPIVMFGTKCLAFDVSAITLLSIFSLPVHHIYVVEVEDIVVSWSMEKMHTHMQPFRPALDHSFAFRC